MAKEITMKRKLIRMIAIVCVAAICATLFVGCRPKLSKPTGLSYNNGTLSWDAVEGAEGYMVQINDGEGFFVTETSVGVDNANVQKTLVANQTNTLYLMAVTRNDKGEIKSKSKISTFEFDYAEGASSKWKVTFHGNYEGAPEAEVVNVAKGQKVSKPTDPKRSGFTFAGWYRDTVGLIAFEFEQDGKSVASITADTDLYAKWREGGPVDPDGPVIPTDGVVIIINGDVYAMTESESGDPDVVELYTYTVTLNVGDTVTIKDGDNEFTYEAGCGFMGTATVAGSYTFYAKVYADGTTSVYVDVASGPVIGDGKVVVVINGDEANAISLQENTTPEDPNVEQEYYGTIELKEGDTVRIFEGGFEYQNYEAGCPFKGTAKIDGEYTFYVKKYADGDSIWVEVPEGFDPSLPSGDFVLIVNNTTRYPMSFLASDDSSVLLQYTVKVTLKSGDKVTILEGDYEYKNYEKDCGFTGTATIEGSYTFYAKKYADGDSIWVTVPKAPVNPIGEFVLIVNGDEANAHKMTAYESEDSTVAYQYSITITLQVGDKVTIKEGSFVYSNYEAGCGFKGEATVAGSYTFYAKRYSTDRAPSVWVQVPSGFVTTPGKTIKIYLHLDLSWLDNWKAPTMYCWNNSSKENNGGWPGVKMKALGDGVFCAEIDADYGFDMIIFTARGDGSDKTADMKLVIGNSDEVHFYSRDLQF